MSEGLTILSLSEALADHAAGRQALIARNVAHADTPRYRAADLTPFSDSYAARAAMDEAGAFRPAASRAGHLTGTGDAASGAEVRAGRAARLVDVVQEQACSLEYALPHVLRELARTRVLGVRAVRHLDSGRDGAHAQQRVELLERAVLRRGEGLEEADQSRVVADDTIGRPHALPLLCVRAAHPHQATRPAQCGEGLCR